jgi:hypothetical protein
MKIQQKTIEVTDVILSIMNKKNENWGFGSSSSVFPTTEAEYKDTTHFDGGTFLVTFAELQAEYALMVTGQERIQYQFDRQNEYPPLVDQLDTIFHGGVDAWKAQIQAIKDKYPKS